MSMFESETNGKPTFFTRRNTLVLMMLVLLSVTIGVGVSANLFNPPPPQPTLEPFDLGTFTEQNHTGTFQMKLKIYSAEDLYAWQVMIYFNASELVFVEATEGDFLAQANAPGGTVGLLINDMIDRPGKLLVGSSLTGENTPGVSGNGILATITFGSISEDYKLPYIEYKDNIHSTYLLDSSLTTFQGDVKLEKET